jgi:copper chaperone CopZ
MESSVKGGSLDMNLALIQTDGMHCDACPPRIESELSHLTGVKDARAFRSMHLTSVLFDADIVDVKTIRDRIAGAGFETHVLGEGRAH